jgi:hypothetical protein
MAGEISLGMSDYFNFSCLSDQRIDTAECQTRQTVDKADKQSLNCSALHYNTNRNIIKTRSTVEMLTPLNTLGKVKGQTCFRMIGKDDIPSVKIVFQGLHLVSRL